MDLYGSRSPFRSELENPAVRDRLFAMTHAEVGSQGPQAQQAFLESILNRAASKEQPISRTLTGPYFPGVTYSRAARGVNDDQRAYYGNILDTVLGGSNISNYATGNASGTVGFAGGPQTFAAGGERFGIEGPDREWARKVKEYSEGPLQPRPPVPYTDGLSAVPAPRPNSRVEDAFDSLGGNPAWLGDAIDAQNAAKRPTPRTPEGDNTMPSNAVYARGALTPPPGVLSDPAGGGDWGDALQGAGAWLMAPESKGASLSALNALTANRKNDRDYRTQQDQIAQTEQTLSPILGADAARAIARNPHLIEAFTPKAVQTGSGLFGPTMGVQQGFQIKPMGATGAPTTANGQGGLEDTITSVQAARDQGASRDDLLKLVPAPIRDIVKARIEGRDIPGNMSRVAGNAKVAVQAFTQAVDPTADDTAIEARKAWARGENSPSPGSFGTQIRSSGTLINHIHNGMSDIGTFENGLLGAGNILPGTNAFKGWLRNQMGDSEYQKATGDYDVSRKGAAGELERILSGSHGAEASKQYWLDAFDINKHSINEVKAAWASAANLMAGRMSETAQQKERAYRTPVNWRDLLSPEAQSSYKELEAQKYSRKSDAATPTNSGTRRPLSDFNQ